MLLSTASCWQKLSENFSVIPTISHAKLIFNRLNWKFFLFSSTHGNMKKNLLKISSLFHFFFFFFFFFFYQLFYLFCLFIYLFVYIYIYIYIFFHDWIFGYFYSKPHLLVTIFGVNFFPPISQSCHKWYNLNSVVSTFLKSILDVLVIFKNIVVISLFWNKSKNIYLLYFDWNPKKLTIYSNFSVVLLNISLLII